MHEALLRENLQKVEERIRGARQRSARNQEVTIVAVTKGHPVATVRAALAVGLHRCGENRVAELDEKVAEIGRTAAEWHLIGHLQRNKVGRALQLFDLIHSIDSLRLANELSAQAERTGSRVRGLVQVNVSGEETKGGFEGTQALEPVVEEIRAVAALPGLDLRGLMTMAPFTSDEPVLRQTFQRARTLFDMCGSEIDGFTAQYLSMGMSNDFDIAVEEGSTMVRLGTTLRGTPLMIDLTRSKFARRKATSAA
jgi:pyridoxal phosphate enzyme (YggS family)